MKTVAKDFPMKLV